LPVEMFSAKQVDGAAPHMVETAPLGYSWRSSTVPGAVCSRT
jgi:hypothetical protein